MEALMVERVQTSLAQFVPRNALFFCERLCAQFPSETNQQLLATCYLQNDQAYAAYHILKGKKLAQSRYLFAVSCYHMELLKEAESALCPPNEPTNEVPNGGAGHYLLGLIYRYTGRKKAAIEQFTQSLVLDPLLWVAYEELCNLGAAKEAKEWFNDDVATRIHQQQHLSDQALNNTINVSNSVGDSKQISHSNTDNLTPTNFAPYETPSPTGHQISAVGPPPLYRNMNYLNNNHQSIPDISNKPVLNVTGPRRKHLEESKIRRVSERLFDNSGTRRSTRNSNKEGGINSNSNSTTISGNNSKLLNTPTSRALSAFRNSVTHRRPNRSLENFDEGRRNEVYDEMWAPSDNGTNPCSTSAESKLIEQDKSGGVSVISLNGVKELLGLLQILGEGYRLSSLYKCQEALQIYQTLSEQHFNTGWVLIQVGKAHFELIELEEADRFFDLSRRLFPYILEGMDIYSTVLYQMKEETRLSYLARDLSAIDRLSPQTWCAMGNCYSIQKEHESALKSFHRATQIDPLLAYAHTLCGHEYTSIEDYEKGLKCYMTALQVDERHYNAWYGLGILYLKQDKFQFAEHHFRYAYCINPRSSVLLCYLGMTLHSLKRGTEALAIIDKAREADGKNLLAMYQKAQILVSMERYEEALEQLHELEGLTPKESSVFALMAKIYKHLNMHHKAMFYFGIALDLKPPPADAASIKAAMEKLYLPDEMEDI